MIREITCREPMELFMMIKDEPHSFILESSMFHETLGRYSIVGSSPFKILKYKNDPRFLEKFRKEMNQYSSVYDDNLPFHGGAIGYISYDGGKYFEDIKSKTKDDMDIPDLYFGLYDWAFAIDHLLKKTYIVTADINAEKEKEIIVYREKQITEKNNRQINGKKINDEIDNDISLKKIQSNFTKKEYINRIEKVREYIRKGDIYQANLTQRFEGETEENGVKIYNDLRQYSPTLFGGLLNFEQIQVISNSPERFIKVTDNIIETRPIKGTRPRGASDMEDESLKEELKNSEKDKAELLMIVDLERNDLGRVSRVGSVKVPELFKIETYQNVHHLVATIRSKMAEGLDVFDVIKATFPGGSITGAPKIRAMEIIEELEPTCRNIYTGSMGYIGFDGTTDLNIAIRTIVKKGSKITFQAGGGITWDSKPEEEYQESLDKAEAIMQVLHGCLDKGENDEFKLSK